MYGDWDCTYPPTKCAIVDLPPLLLLGGTRFFLSGLLLLELSIGTGAAVHQLELLRDGV